MTEKLYETNGSALTFSATVLSCERAGDGYAVKLDRTAFFPGGGGQACDVGLLGGVPVSGAALDGVDVIHYVNTPLTVGANVEGAVDAAVRFPRMQCHTAEHIVSGLIHAKYGYDNVGFHLGYDEVTMDFNGELSREQLDEIEDLANRAVYADLPVTVSFPSSAELLTLSYRSKLDLTENVRLVTVEGIDVCACCAPHVEKTGEIGLIRLLGFIRYKGGVRIRLVAGERALADYRARCRASQSISEMLSVPQEKIADGVARALANADTLAASKVDEEAQGEDEEEKKEYRHVSMDGKEERGSGRKED
ncbi:MAG: alanyl-tRNA editing protein, partial [Clostridia bacterium]|nr:alanyl-tRNA editing protein [Clostridia bacterium]